MPQKLLLLPSLLLAALILSCDRSPANPPEHSDELYHCGGGVSSFTIDPYGGMSICVLSQVDKFDLRTGHVREGAREEHLLDLLLIRPKPHLLKKRPFANTRSPQY